MPNMIWLYRGPILAYWTAREESLAAIVTHVLVHEIGHHFGLSDADMEAIEAEGDLEARCRSRVGEHVTKFCSVTAMAMLVIASLGPGKWVPRTGLGFEIEHVLAFFVLTSIVCLAWPLPFVVGGALMGASALLEGLQALTPNRVPNLSAAFYGAVGALAAALLAELFIRSRMPRAG